MLSFLFAAILGAFWPAAEPLAFSRALPNCWQCYFRLHPKGQLKLLKIVPDDFLFAAIHGAHPIGPTLALLKIVPDDFFEFTVSIKQDKVKRLKKSQQMTLKQHGVTMTSSAVKTPWLNRSLNAIERIGNKLPRPCHLIRFADVFCLGFVLGFIRRNVHRY